LIGIISLAFGLVTPPYGLCLMISCAIGKMRLMDTMKDVTIMLIPCLLVLATIIMFPGMFLAPIAWVDPQLFK
jgi:TRAP-type C4-dicarboxylate transport system permease large subunit